MARFPIRPVLRLHIQKCSRKIPHSPAKHRLAVLSLSPTGAHFLLLNDVLRQLREKTSQQTPTTKPVHTATDTMDVKVLAQMAIKTEELYPEDDRDLNALVEQMKARKAAAEPGGRGNPFLIHSDAGGEELLAQQQQPPNYLSTLLQHGLYTPKQHTFRPLPSLTQEMMTTVEPEVMGMPISGFCAPQSGPELADITASLPAGSSRPKRKFAIVENSDGDSKFEPDSDDEPLNSGRTTVSRNPPHPILLVPDSPNTKSQSLISEPSSSQTEQAVNARSREASAP